MWAPANSASQRIRLMTRATTSPGFPGSTWVTKATRCIDSAASALPTTCSPAVRSSLAWITCTVLSTMLAKRTARSRARRLVSPPSKATAHERIGEGGPPPAHQDGVRPRREPRQHDVGVALLLDGLRRQARREQALARALQHRPL